MVSIVLFFLDLLMVDPFASTNPTDPSQQSDTKKESAHDIFGGVPDIFSDMAATAFQPIDPETGRPTEHTAETLDPFLRDDLSDTSSLDMYGSIVSNDMSDPTQELVSQHDVSDIVTDVPQEVSYELVDSESISEQENVVEEMQPIIEEPTTEDPVVEKPIIEEESPKIEDSTQESVSLTEVSDPIVEQELPTDAEIPSYFETSLSFDDEPVPSSMDTPMQQLGPSLEQDIQSSQKPSDHYDPFVDDLPVGSTDSIVGDDPFLQDTAVEVEPVDSFLQDTAAEVESVDPFLQDTSLPFDTISSEDIQEEFVPEESSLSLEGDPIIEESVHDVDGGLDSLDDAVAEEPNLPVLDDSLLSGADVGDVDDSSQVVEESPSMVQGLVEGILDPFVSSKTSVDEELAVDFEPLKESIEEDKTDEIVDTSVLEGAIVPGVVASVIQNEVDEPVVDEEIDPIIDEPAVAEDEQDMQKSGRSDVFVKFQELLQRIYRVHDDRGGHDTFTVVGADNDALYITYSFAIEPSVEQAIMITKESTDRKDSDAIDTHVLRFTINSDSLVEVYVDGILLFVEDQLVDNVKAKMQLMDKFNKFIFLIDQFVQDTANQVSGEAVASAQEEFGGF